MEIIYYNPLLKSENHHSFRSDRFVVRLNLNEWSLNQVENAPRFTFSTNSYCAIILLKIFSTVWRDLPIEFRGIRPFDAHEETIILRDGLDDATKQLRRFANTITGNEVGTDLKWSWTTEQEFRIVIDMIELKTTLLGLADFLEESSRELDKAVEFWL